MAFKVKGFIKTGIKSHSLLSKQLTLTNAKYMTYKEHQHG